MKKYKLLKLIEPGITKVIEIFDTLQDAVYVKKALERVYNNKQYIVEGYEDEEKKNTRS